MRARCEALIRRLQMASAEGAPDLAYQCLQAYDFLRTHQRALVAEGRSDYSTQQAMLYMLVALHGAADVATPAVGYLYRLYKKDVHKEDGAVYGFLIRALLQREDVSHPEAVDIFKRMLAGALHDRGPDPQLELVSRRLLALGMDLLPTDVDAAYDLLAHVVRYAHNAEIRMEAYQQLLARIDLDPTDTKLQACFDQLLAEVSETEQRLYQQQYNEKMLPHFRGDNWLNSLSAVAQYGPQHVRRYAVNQIAGIIISREPSARCFKLLGDCYAKNPGFGNHVECYQTASRLGSVEALTLGYPELRPEDYFGLIKVTDNRAAFIEFERWVSRHPGAREQREQLAQCYLNGYGVDPDERKARDLMAGPVSRAVSRHSMSASRGGLFWHDGSYIKKIGHELILNAGLLGLGGGSVNFYGAHIGLEGYFSDLANKDMQGLVQKLMACEIPDFAAEHRDAFLENYQANLAFSKYTWSIPDFQRRLADKKTVVVATGWSGHAITLSFQTIRVNGSDETYMSYTNRGERKTGQPAGTRVFRLNKDLTADEMQSMIKKIQFGNAAAGREYLEDVAPDGDGIGKDLGLYADPVVLPQSDQKVGNCSLISAYSQVEMALMFHYAHREDCRKEDGSPNFEEAFRRAKLIYKPWRFMTRVTAVKNILKLSSSRGKQGLANKTHQQLVGGVIDYVLQTLPDDSPKFCEEDRHTLLDPVLAFLSSADCTYPRSVKDEYCAAIETGFLEGHGDVLDDSGPAADGHRSAGRPGMV